MQERVRDSKTKSQFCCEVLRKLCNMRNLSNRPDTRKLHNSNDTSQHFLINIRNHKRGASAKGSTLLPLALRPRLLEAVINYRKVHSLKIVSNFAMLSLIAVTISIIQNFAANNASATSLTLEVPTAISLDITPSTSGTFAKSNASNVSVKTDAPWGYNLTIKGKSSDTSLTNTTSTSSKLTSITSNLTEEQFKSGTNNTWGYLPSKVDGAANTSFRPGPGTSATTIEKTSTANANTANNYSIMISAKVDNTAVAGTYTNTFTLTSVANSVSYNISYNLNSGSWSGTSPQAGNTTASTITLDSHTPTKSNYTFIGWCTSSNITNNNTTSDPTCNGTKYSVGGTYNLDNGSNAVTMYAMWKQNGTSYSISYNCNSGSNCPSTQTGVSASDNVTLSSTTPSKSGYTFQGWCSTSASNNNTTSVSCSGYTYQPNNSYPLSRGASVTLYAMWKKNLVDGDSCPHSGWSGATYYYRGLCWMWEDYRTNTNWYTAMSVCPSGWRLPSAYDFQSSISGMNLEKAGWSLGRYWTSDDYYTSDIAWNFYVYSGGSMTGGGQCANSNCFNNKTNGNYVRCVTNQ